MFLHIKINEYPKSMNIYIYIFMMDFPINLDVQGPNNLVQDISH